MLFVETNPQTTTQTQETRPRILISDDQHDILTALALLLKLNRYVTETVDSPAQAIELARTKNFDLFLIDLNYTRDTTSGEEGLRLLSELRQNDPAIPVVVMTAWGNVELAVEAMRLGASDFIQKPWENQRLLDTIRKQIDRTQAERKRSVQSRSELEIARHVQQKMLPQQPKALETLELAASCLPAREVGGDYYDFFDLGPGRMGGLLADVSGKGVAAAMLMANLQACFRAQLDRGNYDARALIEAVNRLFYASTPAEQYVTVFYFDYSDETRLLRYVNCGHVAPALVNTAGVATRLGPTSTVVGLFPQCPCECGEIQLNRRELLVIFTDGVTEFSTPEGDEFGEDRFLNLVLNARQMSPPAIVSHITDRLESLRGASDQFDDQTILLLKGR